jgi:hypothetical protein
MRDKEAAKGSGTTVPVLHYDASRLQGVVGNPVSLCPMIIA